MAKKLRTSSIKVLEFLTKEISIAEYYEWGFVVELLVKEFKWSPKTCSNRIHELIELGLMERVGTFEKPTPRRKGGHDLRKVKIISQLSPQNQSDLT
jgi:hypothetical protein